MKTEKNITCLAVVQIIPDKKKQLIQALNQVKAESFQVAGCIDYQVLVDENQPNILLIRSVYKSKQHFDKHFETNQMQWFMKEIKPLTCIKINHDLYEEAFV
ncbi:putative quinol monooxygenase [Parachlamydia acanthamoebae]|uniref:putative quinol monooxygenase n=1 Tax=Parachlamydia acanthamoebae TaxID=83552 RepID=UPI000750EE42|nr:antibiotic biosynthesis monooxygenase [Parachlamydia acanthamoebae]